MAIESSKMESMVTHSYLKSVYEGKKIFVTGHTGFKGSWLITWLHILGAEIKGYALEPLNEFDLYHQINGDDICNSIISDIRDKKHLTKEIIDFQPDFIFHLAAQPLVRLSYEIPVETMEVNIMGTVNVLDTLKYLKKSCVAIMITTDKVYENKEWSYPYREVDRLGGYDPYSASKAAAELVISSYRNSFFNPVDYKSHRKSISTARAGNVIGGGDWAKDRLIPDIIRALQNKEAIILRNPHAIRPWQHVLEPLGGYLLLGAKMKEYPVKFSDSWNFGPFSEDNLSVQQLVEFITHVWGDGIYTCLNNINEPHEAGLLKLDINKAITDLGWKPKWNSEKAVIETIGWYKQYINNKEETKSIMSKQIFEYA